MALKDIIGQDKAVSILLRTFSRGRMPSAYLFAGESGIGKKFTAVNFAKVINCEKTAGSRQPAVSSRGDNEKTSVDDRLSDCCDECSSCKKTDAKTHPDFLMVIPEKGEIRINEIRAVEEALSFKPYEGRRKIVIIDDADAMNQSAANAFLKTLEEPPDESLLMLVTSNPDRLPETIRSRCSRVNFTPLSAEACERVLKAVSSAACGGQSLQAAHRGEQPAVKSNSKGAGGRGQELIKIEDSQLSAVIRLSMGRPGLAVSSDILNDRERHVSLLKSMLRGDNDTWADRDEMEEWFNMASFLMRDMVVFKITGDADMLLNADIKDYISDISKSADITNIINTYDKIRLLKGQLDFNLNKAITWNYTASIMKTIAAGSGWE